MKSFLVVFLLSFFTGSPARGSKLVQYESKLYHTVKIGGRCWLDENLNVGTMVTGVTAQTNNAVIEKYCYGDNLFSCELHGGFYQWDEAMQYSTAPGAPGICPPGWHIPTSTEYYTLQADVSYSGNALKNLEEGGAGGAGTNVSGFSAMLSGLRLYNTGGFLSIGEETYLWHSTQTGASDAGYMLLNYGSDETNNNAGFKTWGFSVRCIENQE